ncbi:DUF4232 domain-containing protein [Streptomyces sporangiiformans]|uniref:DUF4232 domain-containing protein n=1 Tax=Streptomyces sporangiiformans TaxID=2315329 RepID=UPI0013C43802|nr:DUF4232 domain-containing protein [Streptomyces sporangiiformans]
MIAIRRRSAQRPAQRPAQRASRYAALACVLALGVSGCGLSAELERERDPAPKPPPSPIQTTPHPATATPKASPTVPVQQGGECPPSGVRFGTGLVDAAMGLRAMSLTMTNCGDRPYKVNGYPSVQVLDKTGAPLTGVRTVEGTDEVPMAPDAPEPKALTLAPGETAHAGLYWRTHVEKGIYLRVAPQKGRDFATVRADDYLDIGPENILGTTAWVPLAEG